MSPKKWPTAVSFDPDSESIPPELVEFGVRSAASPGPALVVAVGERAEEEGWAHRALIALATSWADHGQRIIVADLSLDAPRLHSELGEANTDGLADIFQFGASLKGVMRVVPGRGLRFIPAGAYVPDSAEVLRSAAWDDIIARLIEDDSVLLGYLPGDAEGGLELAGRFGRAILLADPTEIEDLATRFAGVTTVGLVVVPPSPEIAPEATPPVLAEVEEVGVEADEDPAESPVIEDEVLEDEVLEDEVLEDEVALTEPPVAPREAGARRRPVPSYLLLLLVVTILGGGWVILSEAGLLPNWAMVPSWVPLVGGESPPSTAGVASMGDGAALAELEESDPPEAHPIESPIPYSVAVEAHHDYTTAMERVELLQRAKPDLLFFLSPTTNQGMIYYRLLSGPVADTTAAWELMRELVESRQKTDLDPWSIRPTYWAYHLGDFTTEASASVRAAQLLEIGIPTYQVEVEYTNGPSRYRLYAGAYEGPAPAEVMADLLREAGLDAPLVRRQGKPIR